VQTGSGVPPASITHRYHAPGAYDATLSLTDGQGQTVAATQRITIVAVQQLTALLSVTPSAGISPLTVVLDGCNSIPANDGSKILKFTMDFGDGSPVETRVVDATHVVDCNAVDRSSDPRASVRSTVATTRSNRSASVWNTR